MKIILHAVVCFLAGILALQSQVLYNGGSYSQNFNTLSQDTNTGFLDFSDPWNDNTTIAGWYSNMSSYTTDPGILGTGLGLTSSLTSAGSGSDRALGSYLGTVGGAVVTGVQIRNNQVTPMTQFTLTFDIESSISGLSGIVAADVVNAFGLAYNPTAGGLGATGYENISGSLNVLSLNLLGSGSSSRQLSVTVGGLNITQGNDLWIRFTRNSLLSIGDNSVAIDNFGFTAVPEPGTYALFGIGVLALVIFHKTSLSKRRTLKKDSTSLLLVLGVALTSSLPAQNELPSSTMEETVVRPAPKEKQDALATDKKESRGSAVTYEYKPQWNRMMLVKDFENTYRNEIEKGEIVVVEPSQYFKAVRNYHVSNSNNSTPPPTVWLRHESYLIRGVRTQNGDIKTADLKPELPIARPDTLMPVLDATALFGNNPMSQDDYFNKMFYLRGELMETTEKINKLLNVWDTGTISSQDLAVLQSASKVEWLVCCQLIPESRELNDLLDSLYQRGDIRLNPEAMTPSMAASSGL